MTDRDSLAVERVEAAADIAIGSAEVALKAAQSIPVPPPPDSRDDPNFALLTGPEQSWWARLSPRRNRWADVAAVDVRIADLDRAQQALHDQLADLHQRRQTADADHAARLAPWMADPQGERPQNEAQALDEQITDMSAEHQAIDIQREAVLREKVDLVERRRKSLVRDAERAVDTAKKRYLEAVAAVEAARAELVELNEARIWAAVFPSDTLTTMPPSHALVSGRRVETERNGFQTAVLATSVFSLLRDDAGVFAQVATRDQAALMQGTTTAALTGDEAMWADSDEDLARRKRERERLIAAGGRTTVDALALLEAQRHGLSPIGSD